MELIKIWYNTNRVPDGFFVGINYPIAHYASAKSTNLHELQNTP
jgi:hypothetical protein